MYRSDDLQCFITYWIKEIRGRIEMPKVKRGKSKRVMRVTLLFVAILIGVAGYIGITKQGIIQVKPYQLTMKDIQTQGEYEKDFECLYEELKENYSLLGYKEETLHFNFDDLYQEYKKRLEQVDNDKAFYLLCSEFISHLKDGHMSFKQYEREQVYGHPYTDDVVDAIAIRELDSKNIIVGNCIDEKYNGYEVKSINGIAFDTIVDEMMKVYYNSSFDLGARQSIIAHHYLAYFDLFCEQIPDELIYHVEGPQGEQDDIILDSQKDYTEEAYYTSDINFGITSSEQPSYDVMDQIGYIRIDTFNASKHEIIKTYEEALKTFEEKQVKGLIIDVRNNGGGNESFRTVVESMIHNPLTDPIIYHYKQTKRFKEIYPLRFLWDQLCSEKFNKKQVAAYSEWRTWKMKENSGAYLKNVPIVVLVNESIFSSTDSLVYYCKQNGLATIVGSNYAYSGSGLATACILPSKKFMISYGMQETCSAAGIPLENQPGEPDVQVTLTREDILDHHDAQLEAAKEIIMANK